MAEGVTVTPTTSTITGRDRWDHFLARFGWRRGEHRVEPGLYSIGKPSEDSPVFVTANYTLSFDALRSALEGIDGYILALDTKGVNVWCAAGKGTFGTEELVRRVEVTHLSEVVRHRELVLPQLGAPGVNAGEVRKRTGFKVEYGPVRAADLPEYLRTRQATPEMRRVRFGVRERMTLVPIELVGAAPYLIGVALLLFVFIGVLPAAALAAAVLAGVVLFPILLPWIPTREFSSKGFILGAAVALSFAIVIVASSGSPLWIRLGWAISVVLWMSPITAFLALNFTGSTTFTSRTGVRREILRYAPAMAWSFGAGIGLSVALVIIRELVGT
jgi:hypothetical protein